MENKEEFGPKRENEISAWTVAVGNAPMPWHSRKVKKSAAAAMNFIKGLDGFIGVHPMPPRGTLLLFKSENEAKRARNLMRAEGIQTGDNICEVFIDRQFIKED